MVSKFLLPLFLCPCLLYSLPGYHDPWGSNADLKKHQSIQVQNRSLSPLGEAMKQLIWIHQNIISTVDGPRSHYKPSSSTYMMQAIEKHGFFKGFMMGCDRLIRENNEPWVYRTSLVDGAVWKIDPPS